LPPAKGDRAAWLNKLGIAIQDNQGSFLGAALDNDLIRGFKEQGVPLEPLLCCDSYPQIYCAVKSGGYAGILPSTAPRKELIDSGASPFELNEIWDVRDDPHGMSLVYYKKKARANFGPMLPTICAELEKVFQFPPRLLEHSVRIHRKSRRSVYQKSTPAEPEGAASL
jgi:hypothetical protein